MRAPKGKKELPIASILEGGTSAWQAECVLSWV